MKHNQHIPAPAALILSILQLQLSTPTLCAAVPLRWTVETSRVQPATIEAYQGETLDFEAELQSRGRPIAAPAEYSFYWQTNGMGSVYWSMPCASPSAPTNVLFATWSPANDVGSRVYTCFIGAPGTIYHAAFQLRLRPSPGAAPNALPLPTPTIDFARVTVTNAPWAKPEDMPDGSARPLPKHLHALDFDDSYPTEAAEYYRLRGTGEAGGCSAVRDGGFLYRNFDFPFDDRAEFVVKMSAGPGRFASVGVAQVGTNLTERMVTSGSPEYSARYKWLPGATVDGINEHGVVAEINVVGGDPQTSGWRTNETDSTVHPLGAVRWVLDHATNAEHAAQYVAENIRFPKGWTQNFHYMIADAEQTWIVENGSTMNFYVEYEEWAVLTNFRYIQYSPGEGMERYNLLLGGANITNAWYTNAYRRETNPPWVSDLHDVLSYTNEIFDAWASHPKEYFRGRTVNGEPWWQTVHTSVYDITNRTLRVAVQETDDWYVFAVTQNGKVKSVNGKTGDVTIGSADVGTYSAATIDQKLDGKADRATTLGGYGIADAYAKDEADALLDSKRGGNDLGVFGSADDPQRGVVEWKRLSSYGAGSLTWDYDTGSWRGTLYEPYGYYEIFVGHTPVDYEDDVSFLLYKDGELVASADNSLELGEFRAVTVDRLAKASDIPATYPWSSVTAKPTTLAGYGIIDAATPGQVQTAIANAGHATDADIEPIRTKVEQSLIYSSGVYQYMTGNTNAWFSGTNYVTTADGTTRTQFVWEDGMDAGTVPCSMSLYEIRDGQKVVWDQRDWTAWYWNFKAAQLSNNLARVTGDLAEEVNTNCMKRGWAKYTAVRGLDNPDPSTLWIDTPKVQLMAGHQWEKIVEVGGAGYWTISGNGINLSQQDAESTFLTIKDFEGNACLTFRKTSSYLVYCQCGTDIVSNYMDAQNRVVFHLTTDVQPTAEFSTTLEDDSFVEQGTDGCPANYEWTGSAGNWDCHFILKPGITAKACFARFKVMREGENVVEHTVPIKINGGIVFEQNGQTLKCKPVAQGTSVGSTVNWVIAQ